MATDDGTRPVKAPERTLTRVGSRREGASSGYLIPRGRRAVWGVGLLLASTLLLIPSDGRSDECGGDCIGGSVSGLLDTREFKEPQLRLEGFYSQVVASGASGISRGYGVGLAIQSSVAAEPRWSASITWMGLAAHRPLIQIEAGAEVHRDQAGPFVDASFKLAHDVGAALHLRGSWLDGEHHYGVLFGLLWHFAFIDPP